MSSSQPYRRPRTHGFVTRSQRKKKIVKRLCAIVAAVCIVALSASLIGVWATSSKPTREVFRRADGLEMPACPVGVDEGPINLAVRTVFDDGPVFLGCPDCITKLKANPTKYAAKIAHQRKVLATWPRIQVTCPVSGETIDKGVFIDHAGNKVYFCCERCKREFVQAPANYTGKLAASYTYQTKCPVTGKTIDPAASATAPGGEIVYFCSDQCQDTFKKGPAQYAAKLADPSYPIGQRTPGAGQTRNDQLDRYVLPLGYP